MLDFLFQPQQEQNQWSSGYYGYPQGYDPYGYARPPQDPAMYAYTAYPGYGNYQQQPPQQPPPQQVKHVCQDPCTTCIVSALLR